MPVTVREVARAANVSIGTVSRALNRHPSVSDDVRQRVERAVKSLEYRPLRRRHRPLVPVASLQGKTVTLLLLGMQRSLVNLPVVAAAIHGVEAALSAAGAQLRLVDAPQIERAAAALGAAASDGLLVKSALEGDPLGPAAGELLPTLSRLPCVWFLGRPPGISCDVAEPHDAEAGAMAARYLIERGHRRLAFLDPRLRHAAFRAREAAFRYAAEDGSARVLVLRSQIAEARARQPLGAIEDLAEVGALVDRWQKLKDKERPTAIFVPADNIAALVYRALGERGLRIPRDVSLVSCNREAPLLMGLHPPLSTIDVHAEEIGRRAVDLLIWRFAHPMGPPVHLQIEPTLVEGASVAILRPGA